VRHGEPASILFRDAAEAAEADRSARPECFGDLGLDLIAGALTAGREAFDLAPLFHRALPGVDAIAFRQEVMRDFEAVEGLREAAAAFGRGLAEARRRLGRAASVRHPRQEERWFHSAARAYCDAVTGLGRALGEAPLRSRGLGAFRARLAEYADSEAFAALSRDAGELADALDGVEYTVHIAGSRVTVDAYAGEEDEGAAVEATFARFAGGEVTSRRSRVDRTQYADHVENRILDLVAELHPEVFASLSAFRAGHAGFEHPEMAVFQRESQFCLAYLELVDRVRSESTPFCYPEVVAEARDAFVVDAVELALASALAEGGSRAVPNGFRLDDPERIIVVSGPNHGGKTTFARMFGQLHHLAALGLPVPARAARLPLADRIFTHFERREDATDLRGKLEDELLRIRAILEQATPRSVVIMNESLTSTTLDDALLVGEEVVRRLIDLDVVGVVVTFLDELSRLDEATVSMVSEVDPSDPARRTFRVTRRPADGRAYAAAIARRHGLTYERVLERVAA
jgi:hypothetical protein